MPELWTAVRWRTTVRKSRKIKQLKDGNSKKKIGKKDDWVKQSKLYTSAKTAERVLQPGKNEDSHGKRH